MVTFSDFSNVVKFPLLRSSIKFYSSSSAYNPNSSDSESFFLEGDSEIDGREMDDRVYLLFY